MDHHQQLVDDLDRLVTEHLQGPLPLAHRALQTLFEACVYTRLDPRSAHHGSATALALAGRVVEALVDQQADNGLFTTGDNVLSPPDTCFSVNGLARCLRLVRDLDPDDPELLAMCGRVRDLLQQVAPTLATGGLHTPNHRWEMASALAQLHDLFGSPELLARCAAWLAEGIDVQDDDLYSERSPNYAVHVTNPCLLVLADLLGRPELREVVHRNLHAHILLADDQGRLETFQSRRQDQRERFGLGPFVGHYRRFALLDGCQDCATMAVRAEALGGANPVEGVCDLLRDPRLEAPVWAGGPLHAPRGWQQLRGSGLAIWQGEDARLVARTAPDVAELGRVASGISANPTLATFECPGLRVDSVRLSREFFNLGPMRATLLFLDEGEVELVEHVEAHYYHPLTGDALRPDGDYALEFEGRFAAAMAFSRRERDTVAMDTRLRLMPAEDHLRLELDVRGPRVPLRWEVASSSEVVVERLSDEGEWVVPQPQHDFGYNPGEAFSFLGGTDALPGSSGVAFMAPGRSVWRIRRAD